MIFTIVVAASGWIGYWLDKSLNAGTCVQPGLLIWLIVPLLTGLLLRHFAGDGWKDFGLRPAFKGNATWYVVSLLIYPCVGGLVLLVGRIFGLVTFPGSFWALLLPVFGMGLVGSFIKNIFEELAWRGYLAPRISSLPLNDFAGYLVTGLIWASWHIAYWMFVLGPDQIRLATGQSLATFIPLAILNLIVVSIFYGELRRITGSVWPGYIMHTIGNALIDPLIAGGLVFLATGSILASLYQSLLTPVIFLAAGFWLHQVRVGKQSERKIE